LVCNDLSLGEGEGKNMTKYNVVIKCTNCGKEHKVSQMMHDFLVSQASKGTPVLCIECAGKKGKEKEQ
jgi:hypothetical protein